MEPEAGAATLDVMTSGSLIFVRHAMPLVDPSLPAREWPLSDEGRLAARRLDLTVPAEARVLASTEAKAIQTVSLVTDTPRDRVLTDSGFDEVRREEPIDEGYADRRAAWVRGEPDDRHSGWETFEEVGERMDSAVRRHHSPAMVIGVHGMALTAWLVRAGLVNPGPAAVDFWASLEFPEIVEVTRDTSAPLTMTRRTSG